MSSMENIFLKKSESELVSKGEEGESRAKNRGKRKGSRFVVESKVFEVEVEERKGKIQVITSESKRELLSWVRLGPASGVVHRRVDSMHKGWEIRKMGKWLEGKMEELFSGERGQQG